MSYLQTKENDANVVAFLSAIEEDVKKQDCLKLVESLERISGFKAKMWGNKMVGFGNYTYKTKAGKEGEWFLIGFSPTKSTISLHLMFGLEDESVLLEKLGKHKLGKGCLYIKTLSDIDESILEKIMVNTIARMNKEMNNG